MTFGLCTKPEVSKFYVTWAKIADSNVLAGKKKSHKEKSQKDISRFSLTAHQHIKQVLF